MSSGGTGPQRVRDDWGGSTLKSATPTYANGASVGSAISLSYTIAVTPWPIGLAKIEVVYIVSSVPLDDPNWDSASTAEAWEKSHPAFAVDPESGEIRTSINGGPEDISWKSSDYLYCKFILRRQAGLGEDLEPCKLLGQKPPATEASS